MIFQQPRFQKWENPIVTCPCVSLFIFHLFRLLLVRPLLVRPEDRLERPAAAEASRLAERSSDAVPEGQVLPVVAGVEQVVVSVVRSAVDHRLERRRDAEIAVVDRDSPDVDHDVEPEVEQLVHREAEDVDVVGDGLEEAVDRVEGVAGEWRRDLPGVVRLVQRVDEPVMQKAVDPVDDAVGEQDEGNGRTHDGQPTCQCHRGLQHYIMKYTVCKIGIESGTLQLRVWQQPESKASAGLGVTTKRDSSRVLIQGSQTYIESQQ